MIHSIILKVGNNVIYQTSPHPKPTIESSSSPTEFNRALPEWEHSVNNYLIKKEDQEPFAKYLDNDKISVGVPVPFEEVVTYTEAGTKYAKAGDGTANITEPVVKNTVSHIRSVEEVQTSPNKEHRFYFGLAINDDDGEPTVVFKNDAKPESMDFKLLKSFVIKGKKGGITLTEGLNGELVISLNK